MGSNEKFTVDVFAKLGGDFKFLRQLEDRGLNVNVKLSFNKAKGGGFDKLEKYRKGIEIPINIKMTASALKELDKIKGGMTLQVKGGGKSGKELTGMANAASTFANNLKKLESQFNKTGAAKDKFISNLRELQSAFRETGRASRSARGKRRGTSYSGSPSNMSQMEYNEAEVRRMGAKYNSGRDAERERNERLFRVYEEANVLQRKQLKAAEKARADAIIKYGQSGAKFSPIDLPQQRSAAAKREYEARMDKMINDYERQAALQTKLRRADTDRQLKQRYEAEAYKESQRQKQVRYDIKNPIRRLYPVSDLGFKNPQTPLFDQIFRLQQNQGYISKRGGSYTGLGLDYVKGALKQFNQNERTEQYKLAAQFGFPIGPRSPRPIGPFSPINKPELDKIQSKKDFRDRVRRERAQREYDTSFVGLNASKVREEVAYNYGLLPEDIALNRRKLIDPRRLDKDTVREAGFAALFGAQHGAAGGANLGRTLGGPIGGALGGLVGGVAGGTAAVSGAVLGASFGPGGALVGSALAELGIGVVISSLEALTETFLQLGKAGLEFEQSILSIGAVLQATSTVVDNAGNVLPVGDQIDIQNARAREIQLESRKRLLPLGIGGEKEVGLVSGTVAGLAQAGIGGASADQIATISSLIGAGLQAQRPDLPTNRIRLGTEEFFAQPNRRTVENVVLSAFAPNVDLATSPEEVISSLAGLAPFVQALTHNSDNAAVAVNKFNAEISNLQISLGDDFLKSITPSLKEFTKALKSDETKSALESLSSDVGDFVAFLIRAAADLSKNLPKSIGGAVGGASGNAVGALSPTNLSGLGRIVPEPLKPLLAAIDPLYFFSESLKAKANEADARALESKQNKANEELIRKNRVRTANVEPSALTTIASLLDEESLKGLAPQAAINRGNLSRELLPNLRRQIVSAGSGFEDTEAFKELDPKLQEEVKKRFTSGGVEKAADRLVAIFSEKIASSDITAIAKERASKQGLFNESLASGLASKAAFEQSIGAREISALQVAVSNRKAEIAETSAKIPKNAEEELSIKRRLGDLTGQLAEDENNLAVARTRVSQVTSDLTKQAFSTRQEEALSTVDEGTVAGRRAGLVIRGQRISSELSSLNTRKKQGKIDKELYTLRTSQLQVEQAKLNREKELQPLEEKGLAIQLERAQFDQAHLHEDLNRTLRSYTASLQRATIGIDESNLAVDQAKLGISQAGQSSKQAALTQDEANAALKDFTANTKLRKLENKAALKEVNDKLLGLGAGGAEEDPLANLDAKQRLFNLTGEITGDEALIKGARGYNAAYANDLEAQRIRDQLFGDSSSGGFSQRELEIERLKSRKNELLNFQRDEGLRKRGLDLGVSGAGLGVRGAALGETSANLALDSAYVGQDEAKIRQEEAQRQVDQFSIEAKERTNALELKIKQLEQQLNGGAGPGLGANPFADLASTVNSTIPQQLNEIINKLGGKPVAITPGTKTSSGLTIIDNKPGPAGNIGPIGPTSKVEPTQIKSAYQDIPGGTAIQAVRSLYGSNKIFDANDPNAPGILPSTGVNEAGERTFLSPVTDFFQNVFSGFGLGGSTLPRNTNPIGTIPSQSTFESLQNIIPNGLDDLEQGSDILGGLSNLSGNPSVKGNVSGANKGLAAGLLLGSIDSYQPIKTNYGSTQLNSPARKLEKSLGGIGPSFSTLEAQSSFGSVGRLAQSIGGLAKLPSVDVGSIQSSVGQGGQELVGVMNQVLSTLQNPQGFGAQVGQALRSTFSGGSQ